MVFHCTNILQFSLLLLMDIWVVARFGLLLTMLLCTLLLYCGMCECVTFFSKVVISPSVVQDNDTTWYYATLKFLSIWSLWNTVSVVVLICISFMTNGFPWWLRWVRICLQCRRPGYFPWLEKIPWRRRWQPTPVFLPGKAHGKRSLAGYSPWGHRVRLSN